MKRAQRQLDPGLLVVPLGERPMMAKKHSLFLMLTACFKTINSTTRFYDHTKAHTKPHNTNRRATVGLRFGRGVAS